MSRLRAQRAFTALHEQVLVLVVTAKTRPQASEREHAKTPSGRAALEYIPVSTGPA